LGIPVSITSVVISGRMRFVMVVIRIRKFIRSLLLAWRDTQTHAIGHEHTTNVTFCIKYGQLSNKS